MSIIQKAIIRIAIILTVILVIACLIQSNNNLKNELINYDNNFKALSFERDSLKTNLIAYKLDLEQLELINDSIIDDLNHTRKELKIKDNQILQMQSIKTEVIIKDSITVKDTIFKDNFVKIDSTINNDWYTINFKLEYPSKLSFNTTYYSDLNVFAYSSKEILGTPKKCFIGRIFQKKYKIIRVEVHDKNPYAKIKESKFVIIE